MRVKAALVRWWRDAWFREEPTAPLEVLRVGVGIALLAGYGLPWRDVAELYGPHGWVSPELARLWTNGSWKWSVLFHVTSEWQLAVFHAVFMLGCAAFTLGWQTRWAKWIVLAGHLSYVQRNPIVQYGVDHVLASVLLPLCLAPVGSGLSVGAWRRTLDPAAPREGRRRAWGFACLRLVQLQTAVILFFSGMEKVRGDAWWHGYAVWMTLTNREFANVPIGWLAEHFWIANVLTHFTVFFEIAYVFLVWGRGTRPFCIAAAMVLHLGMAGMMGLYLFSFVMIVAHLSFVRPEWLAVSAARGRRTLPHPSLGAARRSDAAEAASSTTSTRAGR